MLEPHSDRDLEEELAVYRNLCEWPTHPLTSCITRGGNLKFVTITDNVEMDPKLIKWVKKGHSSNYLVIFDLIVKC